MNRHTEEMQSKRIAVVGAGASGICVAKYLLAAGLDVTVFEIGTRIGGLWVYENDNGRSSAYRCLHINSEKRNTQFHDFPFAKSVQYFPSHVDMAQYLKDYAQRFGVESRIRFKSRVTKIGPRASNGRNVGWEIGLDSGATEVFDAVVVASGHLAEPWDPDWAESFGGQYMHSHYYRVPESFSGKRVLVVGTGNSGCDIAADLCAHASRTVMSARSPELIVPKLFLGVPVTQITGMFERAWLPPGVPEMVRRLITRLVHGRMEDWGLRTPQGPTHPTSHATLINHIAYRRVHVKPGISKIERNTVTFDDGSSEEFDTTIAATGYRISYPFVSGDILQIIDGRADLYKRVTPVEWPGIYFVGLFNTLGSSNLRMFEVQSRWIAEIESGRALLPTCEEMLQDIRSRNAYIAKKFPPGARHAIEIEPIKYAKEMARSTAVGIRRRSRAEGAKSGLPPALHQSRSVEDRVLRMKNADRRPEESERVGASRYGAAT